MCLGDNSATLSARYINAQLTAMWENARECAGHDILPTVDLRSGEYQKHKYARSLAEFHFAGDAPARGSIAKEGLFFNGTFEKPRLEFICNHEAVLYLKLERGHFDMAFPNLKVVRGYKTTVKNHVTVDNLEVAFRLKFSRRQLGGKDTRIGSGTHLIQMMILDFPNAQMVWSSPSLPVGAFVSLQWYLKKYLGFLQSAGHHVRFDLPDFDDDKFKPHINYSLVTRALENEELFTNVTVHGINEWKINAFLRETWLNVVSKTQGFFGEPPSDKLSGCLTEIHSTWVAGVDQHFSIKFGPPRIKPLCNHEIVLYFTAAEVHFYESQDFTSGPIQSFVDWEFAFVVDVVEDKFTSVAEPSLKIDTTTARFCHHLSTIFTGELSIYFTHLISFFEVHYIDLLLQYEMLCIYYPGGYIGDVPAPDFDGISEDESEWGVIKEGNSSGTTVTVWTDIIREIKLYGFDHVMAISELSINALFNSLRKTVLKSRGCLVEWHHHETFHADFSDIKFKLLSGNKALVTFTVDHGHLTLADGRNSYDFSSWTISYKVDIKMVDETELHCDAGWVTQFDNMIVKTREGCGPHRTVRHIILDFANAEYIYEHSSQPDMWEHGPLVAREKFRSFIYFMRKYLVDLSVGGYNIIHSTPIFTHTHGFGLTDASFQIVSETVVNAANCMFQRHAPVLIVYGMMGGRPMPAEVIAWGRGWIVPGRVLSHGTLCLSRASFLEARLLAALEVVNRRTTVVPRFPGANEEEWKVHLTTWDEHNYRRNELCRWKPVAKANPGWLEYAWEHRDEWTYEHDGTHNQAFAYAVLCHTKNQLCIPTAYRPRSMEIIVRGESVLQLKRKNDEDHSNWTKRSSAKWSVKVHVNTDASGLRVTIVDQVHPVFDKTEAEGKWEIDTHKMLEEHLPRIIDIREVIGELKYIFEGAWELSCAGSKTYSLMGPVFTPNGDLIMQLGGFAEILTTKPAMSRSPSAFTSPIQSPRKMNGNGHGPMMLEPPIFKTPGLILEQSREAPIDLTPQSHGPEVVLEQPILKTPGLVV
ncbi:hypothetical protein K438DRAFT_1975274 [Mycena galopus ATCC 62051]|nr:hypothetical protein K438DRAFT_1975274 [Mycena galopus ATCC 62051]